MLRRFLLGGAEKERILGIVVSLSRSVCVWRGSAASKEMNGKRPPDPNPDRMGKKRKKELMVEFSDAVTEEVLKKQVAEAWSCRTPFSHGNRVL